MTTDNAPDNAPDTPPPPVTPAADATPPPAAPRLNAADEAFIAKVLAQVPPPPEEQARADEAARQLRAGLGDAAFGRLLHLPEPVLASQLRIARQVALHYLTLTAAGVPLGVALNLTVAMQQMITFGSGG